MLIVPTTFKPSPSSSRRSEGVNLVLRIGSAATIPPSSESGTGPRPTSIDTIRAHGLALTNNVRGNDTLDGVVLVPDGVAKITLRVTRIIKAPVTVDPNQFGTATAPVHDNIAAFQLPIPTATSRHAFSSLFGTAAVAQVTWYGTDGNVIKHTTTSLDVLIKVSGTKSRPGGAGPRRPRRLFCQQNPDACQHSTPAARAGTFSTNAAGQTYGSASGLLPAKEPDLILVTGQALHATGHVTGYVDKSQLDADSCTSVKPRTPPCGVPDNISRQAEPSASTNATGRPSSEPSQPAKKIHGDHRGPRSTQC